MDNVQLTLNNKGDGAFYIMEGEVKTGEMIIGIRGRILVVHHTEVAEKAEGKGLAKLLLTAMVEHARSNNLKVIPLCPYAHLQFHHHQKDYADVWQKDKVQ